MLQVTESDAEVVIGIETTFDAVGCGGCGTRAESQDRMTVEIRDLACFGRPAPAGVAQAPLALRRRRL